MSVPFPPSTSTIPSGSLTGTASGQTNTKQNGTYTIIYSTTSTTNNPAGAFNGNYWQSKDETYLATGLYPGSYYTGASASIGGYNGEYIGLRVPSALTLTGYTFITGGDQWPRTWYILGSNDQSSWTLLDSRVGITLGGSTQFTYSVTTPSSTYTYFVMVVTVTQANSTGHKLAFKNFQYLAY